jgi:hypothetical protein
MTQKKLSVNTLINFTKNYSNGASYTDKLFQSEQKESIQLTKNKTNVFTVCDMPHVNFVIVSVEKFFSDTSNDLNSNKNISMMNSVLTCLIPGYNNFDQEKQQLYVKTIKALIVQFVEKNFIPYHYKSYGWTNSDIIEKINNNKESITVLKVLCDYFDINIFFFDENKKLWYVDTFNKFKKSIVLLFDKYWDVVSIDDRFFPTNAVTDILLEKADHKDCCVLQNGETITDKKRQRHIELNDPYDLTKYNYKKSIPLTLKEKNISLSMHKGENTTNVEKVLDNLLDDCKKPEQKPEQKPEKNETKKPEQKPEKNETKKPEQKPEQNETKKPEQNETKKPEQNETKKPEQKPEQNETKKPEQKPEQNETKKPEQKPEQNETKKPEQKPEKNETKKPEQKPEQNETQKTEQVKKLTIKNKLEDIQKEALKRNILIENENKKKKTKDELLKEIYFD